MFRGCIPKKNGVGGPDFTPNDDPIAAGAIGEESGVKDVVPTSALMGIAPLNGYPKGAKQMNEEIKATLKDIDNRLLHMWRYL